MSKAQFGVIGMAVMGRNLAQNISDHGFSTAVWNLEPEMTDSAVKESGGKLHGFHDLREFVGGLERPRKMMMMIRAGAPVDKVIESLRPLLEEGDIIIDGGNSWFEDTRRREKECADAGLRFFGIGVSGGEEGARHGPSIMPGGDKKAYEALAPVLEAIAAKTDTGPCVTYCGPDGAGHFVKMVHNGIEYADMQLIAEAYHLLRDLGGLTPPELGDVFDSWNGARLESFLIEISAKVFKKPDPKKSGAFLVDSVLDKAGQKGTGKWTAQVALDLAVPVPSIQAAIDARVLSSMKTERERASQTLTGPKAAAASDKKALVASVEQALYAAKIGAYAQGLALLRAASDQYSWGIELGELARIWKGGCIIRARFLDEIRKAYADQPDLANLMLQDHFRKQIDESQKEWRRVVSLALENGIPVPAMSASLAYYDAYRTASLPQNLTQAQRDAFGAHTYQRTDDPDGPFVHTEWLG